MKSPRQCLLALTGTVAIVAACERKEELPLVTTIAPPTKVVVPPPVQDPRRTPAGCEAATIVPPRESPSPFEIWRYREEPEFENPDEMPRAVQPIFGEYTPAAVEHRISGMVVLEIVVAEDGRVAGARVLKGLPCGLEKKAMEAARKARLIPAQKDGKPIATSTTVAIHFRLPLDQRKK